MPAVLAAWGVCGEGGGGGGKGLLLFLLFLHFFRVFFQSPLLLSVLSPTISSISFLPLCGRRHRMT